MNVYFTSDLHIGHKSIIKYRDQFDNAEQHHEFWLYKLSQLTKREMVIILGDFIFDCERYDYYIEQIDKMPTKIKLIMGNHDSRQLYDSSRPSNIELMNPLVSYKNMWLTHCPIHPSEIRRRLGVVHGHLHFATIDDPRYYNVCPEHHNYHSVPLDTVKQHFNSLLPSTDDVETIGCCDDTMSYEERKAFLQQRTYT